MSVDRTGSMSERFAVLFKKPVIDRVRVSRSVLTHKGALVPVRVAAFGLGYLRVQSGPWLFFWGRVNQVFWARADDEVCTITFRGLLGRDAQSHPIGPLLSPAPARVVVGRAEVTPPGANARVLKHPARAQVSAMRVGLRARLKASTRIGAHLAVPQVKTHFARPHRRTLRLPPPPPLPPREEPA